MTNHEHLSYDGWRRLVEALLKGKVRRWLDVLRCPECRRRVRQLLALREPQAEKQVGSWDEIRDHFRMELARASEDAARAEAVLSRFLNASQLQRHLWLKNGKLRGNLALCQEVLRRAEEAAISLPTRAWELSTLALELADWATDEPDYRARLWEDCRVRAWLVRCRGRGWLGNVAEADDALRKARCHHDKGSGDLLQEASLLNAESVNLTRQGFFERAGVQTLAAIRCYRKVGDVTGEGWSWMGIAYQYLKAENPSKAMWYLQKSRQVLGANPTPKQEIYRRHNEVTILCLQHKFLQAFKVFEDSQSLYDSVQEKVLQVRRPWERGKLAAGLGQLRDARVHYEQTRRSLLETWGEYDAALLALDYGQLHMELGRQREASRLLEQALPVLRARSLPQVSKAEELLAEAARRARDRHTPTS